MLIYPISERTQEPQNYPFFDLISLKIPFYEQRPEARRERLLMRMFQRALRVGWLIFAIPGTILSGLLIISLLWQLIPNLLGLHGFKSGVGHGRSDDLSFTEMRVSGEDAKFLLRYPRAAGTNRASIRGGRFSEVTLGNMWPDLTPIGVAPEHRLHQRVELEGFKFNKREDFNISVKSKHFIPNAIHNLACHYAADGRLLDAKYYGLFAVNTRPKRTSSGGTRKIDGTYGNLNALKPVPLNEADRFYYLPDNPQENAAISCGRLSCDAIFGWQGLKIRVLFDVWDLPNWKS